MGNKRKRPQREIAQPQKRLKLNAVKNCSSHRSKIVQHPTLSLFYPNVCSLKEYLLSRLECSASKARVERNADRDNAHTKCNLGGVFEVKTEPGDDDTVGRLLNQTLVCHVETSATAQAGTLDEDFVAFSQQSHSTSGSSIQDGTVSQAEVSITLPVLSFSLPCCSMPWSASTFSNVSPLCNKSLPVSQGQWTYLCVDYRLCYLAVILQEIPKYSTTTTSSLSWISTRETAKNCTGRSLRSCQYPWDNVALS